MVALLYCAIVVGSYWSICRSDPLNCYVADDIKLSEALMPAAMIFGVLFPVGLGVAFLSAQVIRLSRSSRPVIRYVKWMVGGIVIGILPEFIWAAFSGTAASVFYFGLGSLPSVAGGIMCIAFTAYLCHSADRKTIHPTAAADLRPRQGRHGRRTRILAVAVFSVYFLLLFLNGLLRLRAADNAGLLWAQDLVVSLVMAPACLWWLVRRTGMRAADFGIERSLHGWRERWLPILVVLPLVYFLMHSLRLSWGIAALEVSEPFSMQAALPSGPLRVVAVVYLALSAAIFEEVFFRSVLWQVLGGWGRVPYCLVSSLLFASVHWEAGTASMSGAFAFGLVAAYYYSADKRTLLPLMAAHLVTDLIAFA